MRQIIVAAIFVTCIFGCGKSKDQKISEAIDNANKLSAQTQQQVNDAMKQAQQVMNQGMEQANQMMKNANDQVAQMTEQMKAAQAKNQPVIPNTGNSTK